MSSQQEVLERNVSVVRRLIDEGFNKGNMLAVEETISPELIEHQGFDPPLPKGVDGTKALIKGLRSMFSDIKLTIEDTAVSGDKVWIRMRASGTNNGSVMGRPPTGKRMEIDVFDLCLVRNGKIVEHWGVPDQLAMLEQIGFME